MYGSCHIDFLTRAVLIDDDNNLFLSTNKKRFYLYILYTESPC